MRALLRIVALAGRPAGLAAAGTAAARRRDGAEWRLAAAERLAEGQIRGPESPVLDAAGRIYAGLEDGRIVRLSPAAGGQPAGRNLRARPAAARWRSNSTPPATWWCATRSRAC